MKVVGIVDKEWDTIKGGSFIVNKTKVEMKELLRGMEDKN